MRADLVPAWLCITAVPPSGQAGEIYDVLRQADSISQKYFVGEDYDTDDLINGALTGYAQGLGDRWTSYMTPEYYSELSGMFGSFHVGIGVTVGYLENDDGHTLFICKHGGDRFSGTKGRALAATIKLQPSTASA